MALFRIINKIRTKKPKHEGTKFQNRLYKFMIFFIFIQLKLEPHINCKNGVFFIFSLCIGSDNCKILQEVNS